MTNTLQTQEPRRAQSLPNAWRIEVFKRPAQADPEGSAALAEARELGFAHLRAIHAGYGYLISPGFERAEVERFVRELFADPVLDAPRVTAPGAAPARPAPGRRRLLVARRPGVMDPVALSVRAALVRDDLVGAARAADLAVQTYRAFEVEGAAEGEAGRRELSRLGQRLFANEVIEELFVDREDLGFAAPAGERPPDPASVPLCEAGDAELLRISKQGALSLSLLEMRAIQAHYRGLDREPTPAELETLAQTWSEHCKHKTFAGRVRFGERQIENLFKETIQRATRELARDWCVSVFHDNAGIVAFEPGWDVCFKVETHNHPSAIDPYGGAGTGIGGVIRDILGCGLGAQPIASTDCFFVGPQDLPDERVPPGSLHPRRILRGVVRGVADYGNRMGIPTVNGGVWFDERYVGNPLVYCGTLGLLPRACATKSVEPGDAIVVVGGRTGRDGIHGATFSSIELSEDSAMVSSAAVQIGDPITEKRVLDALLAARDRGLYRGVTDCGAGGLSSAVGEMGAECGAEVDLERVPLKYPGLTPSEIWISEAQERMVLAVPPESLAELLSVFAGEDCEATAIGAFTASGRLVLRYAGRTVGDLDMGFLHGGTPRPVREARWSDPGLPDPGVPAPRERDLGALLEALLAHPNVQSKEWIVRRYDHEVQGQSVVKPFVGVHGDGPSDAAVLAPLAGSTRGVALAVGANPKLGRLDPRAMAEAAIDEALRNVVAVGGDPEHTALLDNFSWASCERPEELGALVLAAEGCRDAALAYGTPFISGKDSLNNEYKVAERRIAIPPTLLISALAIVPDVRRAVSMDLKAAGDVVFLVGRTDSALGGSLYLERALGQAECGGRVPRPDLERAPRLLRALHAELGSGRVRACHDLSEGGLAVAAAEMAFAGGLGLALDLAGLEIDGAADLGAAECDRLLLFAESCTRFLVEVTAAEAGRFAQAFAPGEAAPIGRVLAEPHLRIVRASQSLIDRPLEPLRRAWRGPIEP